jgi:hypothetical protein
LDTADAVPGACEGMEGRKHKNKGVKIGKFNTK